MSTRCNIILIHNGKREILYHHFDGYPSGVGTDLLIRLHLAKCGIPYFDEEKQNKIYTKFKELLTEEGNYEPVNNVSGDIQYLYFVTFTENGISVSFDSVDFFIASDEEIDEYLQSKYGEHTLTLRTCKAKTETQLPVETFSV